VRDAARATPQTMGVAWTALVEQLASATTPRYRVSRLLGFGGMAGVYLADEPRLGRRVAIKVMSPGLMMDPALVTRFEQEARTTAQLSHPNIVTIYDVDERDGLHYFVMEYIEGRTLGQILATDAASRLPIDLVLHWIAQTGSALAYAHRAGVVHRDVKPGNILIDARGDAYVTDFGIAKVADEPGLTRTGFLVGTPAYMSPEQCMGSAVAGASDQYALGILAYEMIAGAPPFTGPTMGVIQAHLSQQPRPLFELRPDCPHDVATVIARMLAKQPEVRFPSVAAAITAMNARTLSVEDDLRDWTARLVAGESAEPPRPKSTLEVRAPRRSLATGEILSLDASFGGAPAPVSWASSDSEIAQVSPDGVVTARRPGLVTITASTGEYRASAMLSVVAESATTPAPAVAPQPAFTPPIAKPAPAGAAPDRRRWIGLAAAGALAVLAAVLLIPRILSDGGDVTPAPIDSLAPIVVTRPESVLVAGPPPPDSGVVRPPIPPATTAELPFREADPPTRPTPPPPGRIAILGLSTLPPGTQVTVTGNGVNQRVTGGSIELAQGTYVVQAIAPGHENARTTLNVEAGRTVTWSPALQRIVVTPPETTRTQTGLPVARRDSAADAAAIRTVVTGFVSAFASRDVNRIYRDYPAARDALDDGWEGLLRESSVRDLNASLAQFGAPTFDGTGASLRFIMALDFRDASRRQTPRITFNADFRRSGETWTLAQLRIVQ
jgi:serine/threonine-protein kinase